MKKTIKLTEDFENTLINDLTKEYGEGRFTISFGWQQQSPYADEVYCAWIETYPEYGMGSSFPEFSSIMRSDEHKSITTIDTDRFSLVEEDDGSDVITGVIHELHGPGIVRYTVRDNWFSVSIEFTYIAGMSADKWKELRNNVEIREHMEGPRYLNWDAICLGRSADRAGRVYQ